MDSRQQFEEWAISSAWLGLGEESQLHMDADGKGYNEIEVHTAWLAWQASRAEIVIELPPSIGVTPIGGDGIQEYIDCNGEYLHGFAVVESIINAGLTTK